MTDAEALKHSEILRPSILRKLRPRVNRGWSYFDGPKCRSAWVGSQQPPPADSDEWIEYVPEPTWLERIEMLAAGDECEFQYPAAPGWHRALVLKNGGSSYWKIRVWEGAEDFTDCDAYIEQIRLPGQVEAWPR